jgi:hypothetical protein
MISDVHTFSPDDTSTRRPGTRVDNEDVAAALERAADLLEVGDASTHRIRAYRNAARTVRGLDRPVASIAARDRRALVELPGIGERLAGAIVEIVERGTFGLLSRLEGETAPEDLLSTVPGIGARLSARIHEELEITTLEELELAAHDGRLQALPGIGPRRLAAIRDGVAAILRRRGRRFAHAQPRVAVRPGVELLLGIDAEYRRLASEGALRLIAPRRFNPERKRWLPIWHTEREGWEFDVLFSNTARAHALGKTDDWVVIYWSRAGSEQQCTVVTDHRGRRVVLGVESAAA